MIDKIYKRHIDETNEEKWIIYIRHGTQLRFQEEININKFDESYATPKHITAFLNGNLYAHMTARLCEDKDTPQYGPMISWEQFLTLQPQWVKDLLEGTQYRDGVPNPFKICNKCNTHNDLLSTSDGSIKFHDMSFRWVLTNPNGIILA